MTPVERNSDATHFTRLVLYTFDPFLDKNILIPSLRLDSNIFWLFQVALKGQIPLCYHGVNSEPSGTQAMRMHPFS